ncbi:MAG: hypothetical protein ACXVDD_06605 [Polyangia bacterium]
MLLLAAPCFADTPDGGASVSVLVEANGDSTVDVRRGELKVKTPGGETRLRAGESLHAAKGKPPKKLLPAIAPTAPADGATVGGRDVAFAWPKSAGASRYMLEIASTPEVTAGRTQTVDGTRAVLHLDTGTWYWRVIALDGDGSPGRRAVPRRLTIDTTPPKLKTGKPEWR